jgi:hypothetical protein
MRTVSLNVGNLTFSILLKQQQNDFEDQSNQGHSSEVMQLLDEILRQVNPFAGACECMHQVKCKSKAIPVG